MAPQYKAGFAMQCIAEGCNEALLDSEQVCLMFLYTLCARIKMTPLETVVKRLETTVNPQDNGISAVLIIAESHIAVHVWPYYKAVRVVVDSCKDYVKKEVMDFVAVFWGADTVNDSPVLRPELG